MTPGIQFGHDVLRATPNNKFWQVGPEATPGVQFGQDGLRATPNYKFCQIGSIWAVFKMLNLYWISRPCKATGKVGIALYNNMTSKFYTHPSIQAETVSRVGMK